MHADLQMRFVAQFIEEGFLEIALVKSEDNLSNMFTKNASIDVCDDYPAAFVDAQGFPSSSGTSVQQRRALDSEESPSDPSSAVG